MKNKYNDLIIFVLSIITLIISVKLFYNMGIYVDEYGTSPDIVSGGNFWIIMDWVRLFLLGILSMFLVIRLFNQKTIRK